MICPNQHDGYVLRLPESTHVFEVRLFDAPFHSSRSNHIVLALKIACDHRCTDNLGCVDDLLDSRNAFCDAHSRHSREVKCLERHLSTWFADRLGANSAHSMTRLNLSALVFDKTLFKK